jgi:hypothetical protein
MRLARILPAVLGLTASCGSNDPGGPDAAGGGDASSQVSLCGAPSATLSAPGEFSGATVGAGADLIAAEGQCAEQDGWFGSAGEDQVINVDGLVPGGYYVVELDTAEDLAVYVASRCDLLGPVIGEGGCLLYADATLARELGVFVAPATGTAAIVVDASDEPAAPATGAYTVRIRAAECVDGVGALSCDPDDPINDTCVDHGCAACATGFECAADAPACDPTGTCVAGLDACTGDDGAEPDDGPNAATALAAPTAGDPTTVTGAICSAPAAEADWFALDVGARALRVDLTWADAASDLEAVVYDATGAVVGRGTGIGAEPDAFVVELAAGSYRIAVRGPSPLGDAAAVAYTLTVSAPACTTSADCAGATPVCVIGACVAGAADCTGDDAGDAGAGDDGPSGARDLTGAVGAPVSITAAACNTPALEADWYRFTVTAGQGETIALAFPVGIDHDLAVFDADLRLYGESFWQNPDTVELTYLPAGTYYARVVRWINPPATAAEPYTITATRTVAQSCATREDCAETYATQLYRGACAGNGSCGFVAPGERALLAACDSDDDCASGFCSYTAFEADAGESICTEPCIMTSDCEALGPGLTCTTGFPDDVCVPACSSGLDCGANVRSPALDAGAPWDYYVCAASVCSPS